jgi:hypothetical protein
MTLILQEYAGLSAEELKIAFDYVRAARVEVVHLDIPEFCNGLAAELGATVKPRQQRGGYNLSPDMGESAKWVYLYDPAYWDGITLIVE